MIRFEKSLLSHCRLDLWLWAARLYKTRNLAASNIKKGLVKLNGKDITKPSSLLKVGSQLILENDLFRTTILVKEIAIKRVSFEKAQNFYKITSKDIKEAEKIFQARSRYRPDKKVRRNLRALKEKLHFLSDN